MSALDRAGIARDVPRVQDVAAPFHHEIEELLINVCSRYPAIGYVQGMNEAASALVLRKHSGMHEGEDPFLNFCELMDSLGGLW